MRSTPLALARGRFVTCLLVVEVMPQGEEVMSQGEEVMSQGEEEARSGWGSEEPGQPPSREISTLVLLTASPGLTSADLQRAMMNLSAMAAQPRERPIALRDVLNADAVDATGIFEDPAVSRTLIPLLAVGQQNDGELREILRSPQFQQTLAAMTGFIQVDNFNNIMRSFELDPSNPRSREALARGDAMEAMLQAILYAADVKREREAREAAENKGPDGTRRTGTS